MKAKTQITAAVKLYRNAVSDHMRLVENVPNIPQIPRVEWWTGVGWFVDGKFEPGRAPDIVAKYDKKARQLWEDIKAFQAGAEPQREIRVLVRGPRGGVRQVKPK